MTQIQTNLDTLNIVNELRNRFKKITNKQFIKKSIELHYNTRLLTAQERKKLLKEYEL